MTGSKFGFIGELNAKGQLDDLAISDPGWEVCRVAIPTGGHRTPPIGFTVHGIYGRVLQDGKGFFTNDPATHPDRIGLPPGHPPLTAFLGVPLRYGDRVTGMVAVGNREGGYRQQELDALEALASAIAEALARKRAEVARRESEARFSAMANNIAQLAWMADETGWIFWYNKRWYEYTGTTPEQMEGWGWQSVHDPAALPGVLAQWQQSIATGEPFDMEFPLRGADGRFRPFLTRIAPVKDAGGHVEYWFGTNTDISEIRKAQDALFKLNETLEQRVRERTAALEAANKELEAFSYSVSHDLRAPLRGIDGFSKVLLEKYTEHIDAAGQDYLTRVRKAAVRMGQLIDDMLQPFPHRTAGNAPGAGQFERVGDDGPR